MKKSIALLTLVILAGCNSSKAIESPSATSTVVASTAPTSTVLGFWSSFSPEVKTRVESFTANKDCAALQKEFDLAYDLNNPKKVDLLSFLERFHLLQVTLVVAGASPVGHPN